MLRVFQNDLYLLDEFMITLELVPGKDSIGRSVDTVMGIARDSFSDGRIPKLAAKGPSSVLPNRVPY